MCIRDSTTPYKKQTASFTMALQCQYSYQKYVSYFKMRKKGILCGPKKHEHQGYFPYMKSLFRQTCTFSATCYNSYRERSQCFSDLRMFIDQMNFDRHTGRQAHNTIRRNRSLMVMVMIFGPP